MERAIRQFDEIKYQELRQGAGNKSDCRIIYYKARWLWRALYVMEELFQYLFHFVYADIAEVRNFFQ